MRFFKENKKAIILMSISFLIIVQQIGVQYGRWYRAQNEGIDKNGNDIIAMNEVSQLQNTWRKARVEDLITPEKLANHTELKLAQARLKEAVIEIQNSQNRVQKFKGERGEFFEKVHAYYNHSASAMNTIIDFLLAKKGEYTVNENEINFESDTDAERFRILITRILDLHKEKQELDAYISQHNREVEKKLLAR